MSMCMQFKYMNKDALNLQYNIYCSACVSIYFGVCVSQQTWDVVISAAASVQLYTNSITKIKTYHTLDIQPSLLQSLEWYHHI